RTKVPARHGDEKIEYDVALLSLPAMGRVEAANATGDAIRRWNPRYVLLVGIAGGIKDSEVALGDVLISDQIVDYELQKIEPSGPKIRFSVHRASTRLLLAAQNLPVADGPKNVRDARGTPGSPKRIIGPVATGDKVIAFQDVLARYREHWPKLIGVEMEAGGAASAPFQAARPPGVFIVRGGSDPAHPAKSRPRLPS